ncbi:MAG TPA: DICT sensory domain-containing protein [Trichocoleus sp.]
MLEGSILKQLVTDHSSSGRTPLNFGVYYKNTLVALCHALEDCILGSEGSPLVVTAFQRGKWYLQEADRYAAIAQRARQVAIMAAPDAGFHSHPTSQRQNVALVDLDLDDPVSQEWHLIILSPQYTAMVLCQELSPEEYGSSGPPENDLERKFYGFWTFDPTLVEETVKLAIAHIGKYNPPLQQQLSQHVDQIHQARKSLTDTQNEMGLDQTVRRVLDYLQDCRQNLLSGDAFNLVEDLNQNLTSNELQAFLRMAQLVDLSDPVNPLAANEVSSLLEMMGQLLDLPAWQLRRLRLAGLLYRIAPSTGESPSESAHDPLSPTESAPSCPLVPGAQALRIMPRLRAVATIIAHQNEAWDGSGQPASLKGDQIPLESRMLGLVSTFQQRLADLRFKGAHQDDINPLLSQALAACQEEQGQRWDPKLVEILSLMVRGLQQGLSLPSLPARFSLATGLLNVEDEPAVLPSQMLSS